MKRTNEYSPFPIYDTEDLKEFEDKIEKDDDGEVVEFCSECKSLFTFDDNFGNIWCGKCNSLNSVETLPHIDIYLEKHGHVWGLTSKEENE